MHLRRCLSLIPPLALLLAVAPFATVLDTIAAPAHSAPPILRTDEAIRHLGETATVCGVVASSRHQDTTRGKGTFLHVDRPYPHHIFTVIIWEPDRAGFGEPEKTLLHHRICVTGPITAYKGKAEIIAHRPDQITVEKSK